MNKRRYSSPQRTAGREQTRQRILSAASQLFRERGVDAVSVNEIAAAAEVGASTVYAAFKSKEGILKKLFEDALFGPRFQESSAGLGRISDPVEAIATTASVARAIYESEDEELGPLREKAAQSRALQETDQEFDRRRFEMQRARVESLFAHGMAKASLDLESARRLMWMYTSRQVYKMLAVEAGWGPDRYASWLEQTLVEALVSEEPARRWKKRRSGER